jgi:glutamate synthase domain-containing protein 3
MKNLDLNNVSLRELNQELQNAQNGAQYVVENSNGKHNIAVGLNKEQSVTINGHVGYYCAGMNQKADITVEGNAGSGLAENMMSGKVHVKGGVSQYCGATAHGGTIIIDGDASARCGISMKGVDIVVRGSVGHMSAFMAQKGRFVICGDAGNALGDSIYEARIYLRGKAQSLGADCIEKEMQDEHRKELAELLKKADITDISVDEFKRYGSARKLYNFSVDNAY